jgi:DNA-binding transcriptional MerR regulator
MRIKDLAQRAGVTARAVRCYESAGLIARIVEELDRVLSPAG